MDEIHHMKPQFKTMHVTLIQFPKMESSQESSNELYIN